MKFFRSTLITFVTNVFIFGISFLTTIITSRALGPDGKGVLGVANNVIGFSMLFLAVGIESANIFYIGKNKKDVNYILGSNIIIVLFSGIAVSVLYILNSRYHFKIFSGLDNSIIIIVLLITPFMILKSGFINLLLGLQDIVGYNKINLLDRLITFILLVIFIFVFKLPLWIIVSNMIATIIVLGFLVFVLFYKNRYKMAFNGKILGNMVKYGVKNQVGNIIQLLNYRLDIFIINYFLPISQVGIYTNAVALGETMWQVSGSIATVILPLTTNSKDKLNISNFINKVTRITFYMVAFFSIILILISKPLIILLLGSDFVDSARALIWLIPGICIFSISKILANYLGGIGQVEKNIIASSVSCVITVVLDLILIPRIGIIGASLTSAVSYTAFTVIVVFYYVRITKSKVSDIILLKKEDIIEIRTFIVNYLNKLKDKLNKN